MTPPGKPRRVLHPRDLVCPRCGADVDRPCSFSGRVQEQIHCTERLLALGDPGPRLQASPQSPQTDQQGAKPPAVEPSKKRRPLPSGPPATSPDDVEQAPLTLFG